MQAGSSRAGAFTRLETGTPPAIPTDRQPARQQRVRVLRCADRATRRMRRGARIDRHAVVNRRHQRVGVGGDDRARRHRLARRRRARDPTGRRTQTARRRARGRRTALPPPRLRASTRRSRRPGSGSAGARARSRNAAPPRQRLGARVDHAVADARSLAQYGTSPQRAGRSTRCVRLGITRAGCDGAML